MAGVVWITGLSGSGKSTLAREVAAKLRACGQTVILLDGDELRNIFVTPASGMEPYSRETRVALSMQYARLCNLITKQKTSAVIATVSLFEEVHSWNRDNLANYFEVYLDVPMEVLRERDPKGIYSGFHSGKLTNVVGLDIRADVPKAPDYSVEYSPDQKVAEVANAVTKAFITMRDSS